MERVKEVCGRLKLTKFRVSQRAETLKSLEAGKKDYGLKFALQKFEVNHLFSNFHICFCLFFSAMIISGEGLFLDAA